MEKILKVKLDLLELKSKKNLELIYKFFSEHLSQYFSEDGRPVDEFFTYSDCPLCGSSEREHAFNVDKFSYYDCKNCDSIYTYPMLNQDVIEKMYESGAYDEYQKKLVHASLGLRKDLLDKRKVDQIEYFVPRKGLLLDVGCGQGSFLESCRQRGWEIDGVEPSGISAKIAKDKVGVNVFNGFFNDFETTQKYDCITFWGVLEHLLDPMEAIEKASSICKQGGVILFEVPSSECLLSDYLRKEEFEATRYIESGRHNIFFSKKCIEDMLEKTGFEIVGIETNGLDLQTILLEEFPKEIIQKLLTIQDVLNDKLLGDHFRVFARKI